MLTELNWTWLIVIHEVGAKITSSFRDGTWRVLMIIFPWLLLSLARSLNRISLWGAENPRAACLSGTLCGCSLSAKIPSAHVPAREQTQKNPQRTAARGPLKKRLRNTSTSRRRPAVIYRWTRSLSLLQLKRLFVILEDEREIASNGL